MIRSFKDKETEKIFWREMSKKIPSPIQRVAMKKLWMLNAATILEDLLIPPANRLEKLKGKMKDRYSIRINNQWRIRFKWERNDAYDVEIIDYHK